jgi:hypothetical protein
MIRQLGQALLPLVGTRLTETLPATRVISVSAAMCAATDIEAVSEPAASAVAAPDVPGVDDSSQSPPIPQRRLPTTIPTLETVEGVNPDHWNTFFITGNVVLNPTLRVSSRSGRPTVSLILARNPQFRRADGSLREDKPEFYNVRGCVACKGWVCHVVGVLLRSPHA